MHKLPLNICQKLRFAVFCALQLPVSNLLTPEWHIGISDKMKNMGYHPYGADYYVIRADAPIIGAGAYVAADSSAMSALWEMCTRSDQKYRKRLNRGLRCTYTLYM